MSANASRVRRPAVRGGRDLTVVNSEIKTDASSVLGTADAGVFLHARCVGSYALHDPREAGELPADLRARHLLALAECSGCPCTGPCAALLDTLPPAVRGGVWAGRSLDLPELTITPRAA